MTFRSTVLGFLSVMVCISCARGIQPKPVRVTDPNTKLSKAAFQITLYEGWKRSGYFRPEQDGVISLPVFIAIADDNTACILTNDQWQEWRFGEIQAVHCQVPWRIRRMF